MSPLIIQFYERLRNGVHVSDVVRNYISLQKKGGEYLGLCPFHSEKTPSFTVNDQKKFYHCFGCGAHGDIIKFESEKSGISYKDAAYKIAEKFAIALPVFSREQEEQQKLQDRLEQILADALQFYASNMNPEIRRILKNRNITDPVIDEYKIGYTGPKGSLIEYFSKRNIRLDELEQVGLTAKNNDGKYYEVFRERIMIPIINNFGKVIAFGGRSCGNEMPKYINSPETFLFKKGENLFGENFASAPAYKNHRMIIVEGYFDVIAMHQAGFKETVASLGTAVTEQHVEKIWKIVPEIIICMDGDEAGVRSAHKTLDMMSTLIKSGKKVSFALLTKDDDPDDVLKKYGKTAMQKILTSKMNFSEFALYIKTKGKLFASPEEQSDIQSEMQDLADKISDVNLKKNISYYFRSELNKFFSGKSAQAQKKPSISLMRSIPGAVQMLDSAIVCFIINFSEELNKARVKQILGEILAKNDNLNEICSYLIEGCDKKDLVLKNYVLKNTSINERFKILSGYSKGAIPLTVNEIKKDEILDFLMSKRYMIFLKEEFGNVANDPESATEEKIKFYLNEIRTVKNKIDRFNTHVINV